MKLFEKELFPWILNNASKAEETQQSRGEWMNGCINDGLIGKSILNK